MMHKLKKLFYFPIAYYFRFWAGIKLFRWKPRVIVITGSSGKTTLLHLIESQIGSTARYSYKANSSFGIPFDILDIKRQTLLPAEWPLLFLKAPFKAFSNRYKEKLYIVEADCDRPFEGKFLATLLKPEATLWLSISRTHSMNFADLVKQKKFINVEEAIAFEFGYFIENTSKLAVVNGDLELINQQFPRTKAKIEKVTQKDLTSYKIFEDHTEFVINKSSYSLNSLLPKDLFYSIEMANILLNYLDIKPDPSFSKFTLPPGRSSVFKGIKGTTIIDSSYNNSLQGAEMMIRLLNSYPKSPKWLVLGDILEQGTYEKEEHEKLGEIISQEKNLAKIILVGPRVSKYTYPKLKAIIRSSGIEKFIMPKDAQGFLLQNIKGKEVILFKGARFLEGIIEHLLLNKDDVSKLCRRELVWEKRRKQWGL